MKEIVLNANSVDEALELAASQLNVDIKDINIETLIEPKKGVFGALKKQGEFKATCVAPLTKLDVAKQYVESILTAMGYTNFELVVSENQMATMITIECEDVGSIIGRRGETIDSLQYLVSLAINKVDGDFLRLKLDCGNYRSKREQTLEELAKRVAKTVAKTNYSSTLEPMNPYERRIIHSIVSEIEGVSSKSVGEEPYRKVQIVSDTPKKQFRPNTNTNKPQTFQKPLKSDDEVAKVNIANIEKSSFEKEYKKSTQVEQENSAKLYEKLF
jgi:spoIIIJ-associated protein